MVRVTLTEAERSALQRRCDEERRTRRWRRFQAILLLADGWQARTVARALQCCPNSVSNWTRQWRQGGLVGLEERAHPGRTPVLDEAAGHTVDQVLASDPQAHGYQSTGWTVPLLTTELARQGYQASQRTVRRLLQQREWRWKRPKYVLGRPDPAYEEKRGPSQRRPAR